MFLGIETCLRKQKMTSIPVIWWELKIWNPIEGLDINLHKVWFLGSSVRFIIWRETLVSVLWKKGHSHIYSMQQSVRTYTWCFSKSPRNCGMRKNWRVTLALVTRFRAEEQKPYRRTLQKRSQSKVAWHFCQIISQGRFSLICAVCLLIDPGPRPMIGRQARPKIHWSVLALAVPGSSKSPLLKVADGPAGLTRESPSYAKCRTELLVLYKCG